MRLTPVEAREGRVLRERLGYGLCGLDEAEHWATSLIERMDEPPFGLIQLGLARVNGVDVCFEAFDALGLGASTPDDVVLAMASVEIDKMGLKQIYDMLSSIAYRAAMFDVDDGLGDSRSVRVLYRACVPYDDSLAADISEVSRAQWRASVGEFLREVREVAASLEPLA